MSWSEFSVNHMNCVTTSRSEEHTSELQSRLHLVCRLLLEKKKKRIIAASSVSDPKRLNAVIHTTCPADNVVLVAYAFLPPFLTYPALMLLTGSGVYQLTY